MSNLLALSCHVRWCWAGSPRVGGVAAMLAWGGEPEDEDVPVLFEEPRGLRHEVPVDFDRRIAVALDWVVSQRR